MFVKIPDYNVFSGIFQKTAAKGLSVAYRPGNRSEYRPFSGSAAGPLFCRVKNPGKQFVREKTQLKHYFSWAWTSLPVEPETGIADREIGG